ncbi:MAG: hypothetical protein AB7E09_00160 [Candidatus Izemoplasmatales bacterium]
MGNAKNAGKTTVLNSIVSHSQKPLIITSIGLDGEAIDQVTFLEKPQIDVRINDIVVSAKDTLKAFEASYEIIEETQMFTAIGPIVICKITKPGKVLVAGPSLVDDMQVLVDRLMDQYDHRILIDGAFFRQSFAKVSDASIFVVGANDSVDMEQTIDHAFYAYKKLVLSKIKKEYHVFNHVENIAVLEHNHIKVLNYDSILGNVDRLFNEINDNTKAVYFPKTLTDEFVSKWTSTYHKLNFDIVVKSGVHIQLNQTNLKNIFKMDHDIFVINPIEVCGVCINPYSPRGYTYDPIEFKKVLSKKLKRDVINVKEDDASE